jgi:hypothetical protein
MHVVSQLRHLPTRCPLCKGGLIERTSSASHSGYVWMHCLFCNHWWKFHTGDTYVNQDGELAGEMFIVTNNGITYALDAVTVSAIPEDLAVEHVGKKQRERETESQKLQFEIDGLSAALEIAQAEEGGLWKILQVDETNSQKAAIWRLAYNKTKRIASELEKLQAQMQYLMSSEFFFDGLPSGIAMAKTNAEGRFSLVIPRQGRYAIAACGPRNTFRDAEPEWFVWVSLDGETSKRLALSNANVMGATLDDLLPAAAPLDSDATQIIS